MIKFFSFLKVTFFMFLLVSIKSYAVEMIVDGPAVDSVSEERSVRGDLIEFTKNKEIKTSVGTYSLGGIVVNDLRKDKLQSARVTITFVDDQIKQVVIYQ